MPDTLIDTNVSLSRWPFRRLRGDEPAELVAKLRQHHVAQAWVGSLDGLLHRDVAGVNDRLAAECRRHESPRLIPFGTVNPALPDWEEDLTRCHQRYKMPGIRLHPNYHGYRLDDANFARLLAQAAHRDRIVQLVVAMEDERTQHPVFRGTPVDPRPLEALVRKLPRLRLVLVNALRALRPEQAAALTGAGQVYVEIAMLEGVTGLPRLLDVVRPQRVLFGSHFPLFYYESAVLKLQESGLPAAQVRAIAAENARRLLAP
jgi:predicted TIM-barrel fold metal-dependent hydrolase